MLYKLDGGLDHILVDEAQDTSPVQWQVIRALAEEFFAGAGAREAARTLFAVGDEKQSIYGFQGAAPNMFAATGEALRRARRRGAAAVAARAAQPVVPRGGAAARRGRPHLRRAGAHAGRGHVAPSRSRTSRIGQGIAGLVEIWPTEKHEQPRALRALVAARGDRHDAAGGAAGGAHRRAPSTAGSRSGEKLASEDRPIRAGDILILVRKRAPFAAAMISALKARGIPVAGADRLVLTEQIAVQDLIALGDFLVLPEDDLALAAVLKSPLFGLDDDDLLALAPKRQGLAVAGADRRAPATTRASGKAAETLEALARARRAACRRSSSMPGCSTARACARACWRGSAPRRPMRSTSSSTWRSPTTTARRRRCRASSSWLRDGAREIKRDMEQGRDEVRVMTVHGAKGLEAPIVFLPDTCSTRSGRWPGSLLKLDDAERPSSTPAPFLWPVKGTSELGGRAAGQGGAAARPRPRSATACSTWR